MPMDIDAVDGYTDLVFPFSKIVGIMFLIQSTIFKNIKTTHTIDSSILLNTIKNCLKNTYLFQQNALV